MRYDEDRGHQLMVEEIDEEREKLDRDINSFLSEEIHRIDPDSRNFQTIKSFLNESTKHREEFKTMQSRNWKEISNEFGKGLLNSNNDPGHTAQNWNHSPQKDQL